MATEIRKFTVTAAETLIVVEKCKIGREYVAEGEFMGVDRGTHEVLDNLSDAAVRIIRVPADIGSGAVACEDITEQLAREYLYRMDDEEGVTLDDERRLPAYVVGSRAWSLWKDDLEAMRPVGRDPDTVYDATRERQAEVAA